MELIYISKWGGTLPLTSNNLFWLTNVDGLTEATTDISSVVIGGIDGDHINNIQAKPRDIICDLRIKSGVNVEDAKRAILQIIKLKQKCSLIWTQNERTLKINGVVDSIEMARFKKGVVMQVSIHCGVPFWEDLSDSVAAIDEAKPLHYFTNIAGEMLFFPEESGIPLSEYDTSRTRKFYNTGDVSVGMVIEVLAYSYVKNPIIYNQNGEFFGVGYGSKPLEMFEGDILLINTNAGEKSVTLNGFNKLDRIKPHSTWLQFAAGENEFSIADDLTDVENMSFSLIYRQRYI